MNAGDWVLEGRAENFSRLVLENSAKGPVLVDFWAPWVGPSHRQREMLLALAQEYGGRVLLVTVNTDQQKALAREYGVQSLPLCQVFRHGRVVDTIRGVQTEADYRAILERHLEPRRHPAIETAMEAWQRGERERGIRLLAEAAMAEPEVLSLPLTLSRLLIQMDRFEEARTVLEALSGEAGHDPRVMALLTHVEFISEAASAPPLEVLHATLRLEPGNLQARYRLAARLLVEQDDYAGALTQLMEILRQDREFAKDRLRRSLPVLFNLPGINAPELEVYRAEYLRLLSP